MSAESALPLLSSWPLTSGEGARPHAPERASAWKGVVSVLAAADELATHTEVDSMLRRAVELARECIGLERAALYLLDPSAAPRHVLRGTWGTGADGQTTDERGVHFECADDDYEALRRIPQNGARWLYCERARHLTQESGKSTVIGHGWLVITPLVAAGELIGVMFNDTAITHAPMDEGQQVRAAVFCSLLANAILSRRSAAVSRALRRASERSPSVQRVVDALNQDPLVSAQRLAGEIGISSVHLSWLFKAEMGVSVVEYRNRLRIERFFKLVDRSGGNLLDAAMEAGFGSYSQFHRVFRKLVGTTPREYLTGRTPSWRPKPRSREARS